MEAVLSQHGLGNGSALIKHLPHPRTSITSPRSALWPETTSGSSSYPSVQFSFSLISDFLWLHGLQHTKLPCPSPNPGVYSDSCLLSRWCHPTISSSVIPIFSCLQPFPASSPVFSNESFLHIMWPKYWSFSFNISPSNEYSGLISLRIDWFDLLAVQGTLKSLLQSQGSKASILWCSAFLMVQLSHLYMTTGKTIALTRRTFLFLKWKWKWKWSHVWLFAAPWAVAY